MTTHTTETLRNDLQRAGIEHGEVLIVHSSMKSIGAVDDGPHAVVAALRQRVGDRGTILTPAFSDPQIDDTFHLARTPSRTGVISETLRTTPGAMRSMHPTHSVVAIGAQAERFTQGHDLTSGLGVGSPLHKAAEAGARVLMIGCDMTAASVVHIAEAIGRVPYLGKVWYAGYERTLTMVLPDGTRMLVPPRDPPTCSNAFDVVQRAMDARDLIRRVTIGDAACLLFGAGDAIAVGLELLRHDWKSLLCHHPRCPVCTKARTL